MLKLLFTNAWYAFVSALAGVDLQTEALTGVKERRCILALGEREIRRAGHYRHHLTIGILDLNGLKRINDELGHASGDRFIKSVTESISRHIRTSDAIGRIGGDEFLLVFPKAGRTDAERILQRALAELPEHSFSYGLCTMPVPSPKTLRLADLLVRADQRMYSQKRALQSLNQIA